MLLVQHPAFRYQTRNVSAVQGVTDPSKHPRACEVRTQSIVQSILNLPKRTAYGRVPTLNRADPNVQRLLRQLYRQQFEDSAEDRAVGSLLGLIVGDEVGAPIEFQPLQYGTERIRGFDRGQTACLEGDLKSFSEPQSTSVSLSVSCSESASERRFYSV